MEELVIAGEFDYYHKLKDIYGNDFLEIYKELKKKLKEQVGVTTFGSVYLKMLEYEKDTSELLQVVKEYPYLIESYIDILLSKHKNDVARVYKKFIYEEEKKASTRREYKKVCQKIQDFKKVGVDVSDNEALEDEELTFRYIKNNFLNERIKIYDIE